MSASPTPESTTRHSASSSAEQPLIAPRIPLTSLIGREHEIDRVIALLQRPEVRLLTLTGPGGIGKTRLALRVADEMSGEFDDGVVMVPLASLRDPALVPAAVANGLGLQSAPGASPMERMQPFLRDRHLLLVLDNLEHLLDAAPLVVDLLATSQGLKLLCTSRVRIGVSGEYLFPVPPLTLEAAERLFADRARAQVPDFALTDDTVSVVGTICSRLDRLPLAIELAAARTAVLPPKALLSRLDHRLRLLTGGPRDAPERLRDMREAIGWSHDLLSDTERTLFRRLGVFVGGFTLEAAQAVGGENALDGVSSLVASSLLEREGVDGEPRFSMLETIREYALERLEASGEELATRSTHLLHFADLAEQMWFALSGREGTRILKGLLSELGNIRAALHWALEHEPQEALRLAGSLNILWIHSSNLAEGRAWVERVLAKAADAPLPLRTRAMVTAGWLAHDLGDLGPADVYLTEAREQARTLADKNLMSASTALLMGVSLALADAPRAWALAQEGREIADAIGTPGELAVSRLNLGQAAAAMGDLEQARMYLEESLRAHWVSGGTMGLAITRVFFGDVVLAQGDRAAAARVFREAAITFGEFGALIKLARSVARSVDGLACALSDDRPDVAARLMGAAESMRERTGQPRVEEDAARYEQTVADLRATLDASVFKAAWSAGRALSLEDVLAEIDAMDGVIAELPSAPEPRPQPQHGLTPRELEVVRLLADGRSNRAIAEALSLSERTIEHHVLHILTKLNLESRAAAAAWAVRSGLA